MNEASVFEILAYVVLIICGLLVNRGLIREKAVLKEQAKIERWYKQHYNMKSPYFDYGLLVYKNNVIITYNSRERNWVVFKKDDPNVRETYTTLSLLYWHLKLS